MVTVVVDGSAAAPRNRGNRQSLENPFEIERVYCRFCGRTSRRWVWHHSVLTYINRNRWVEFDVPCPKEQLPEVKDRVYNPGGKKTVAFQVHSSGYSRAGFVGLMEMALTRDATRRLRFDVHAAGFIPWCSTDVPWCC